MIKQYYFLLFLLPFALLKSQENLDLKNLDYLLKALSHDSLKGRMSGSVYELKAIHLIRNHIKQNSDANPRFISYKMSSSPESHAIYKKIKGKQLFVRSPKSGNKILLIAHIDHIGMGNQFSRSFEQNSIHNGADDNASGVAMATSLFVALHKKLNLDLFISSGHEIGKGGSYSFFKKFGKSYEQNYIINLDMIGRPKDGRVYFTSNQDIQLPSEYFNFVKTEFDDLKKGDLNACIHLNSKLIQFTTGIHGDYHKPSDDYERIYLIEYFKLFEVFKDLIQNLQ